MRCGRALSDNVKTKMHLHWKQVDPGETGTCQMRLLVKREKYLFASTLLKDKFFDVSLSRDRKSQDEQAIYE